MATSKQRTLPVRGDRQRSGVNQPRSLELLLGQLDQRFLIRELAGLELGINQLIVILHLEAAAACGGQHQVLDVLFERRKQLGRQTDGLGFVVSHRAVGDVDFHGTALLEKNLLLLS